MMSSVTPSEKHSWSGSRLMLENGRTATDEERSMYGVEQLAYAPRPVMKIDLNSLLPWNSSLT